MGDPEVDQPRAPVVRQQDVPRLHVAMDHAALVRVKQRLGDVGGHRNGLRSRERAGSGDPCRQ